ncbi:MAG: pyruvate dehydrogenase (acetyl-transferring) E1 component subunit alpha, partial [Chthoniobacterales bacterium]
EEGVLDESTANALDKAAKEEANAAAKFALESDFPSVEDIYDDVYWEVDKQTEAGRTGRHFFNS